MRGFLHGMFDFLAGWVDHPYQSNKDQIFFQFFHCSGPGIRGVLNHAEGQSQHAQCIFGHGIVGIPNALAQGVINFLGFIIYRLIGCTQVQNKVWSTLDGDHIPSQQVLVFERRNVCWVDFPDIVDGDHAFAFRVERDLVFARIGLVQFLMVGVSLGSCDQQRALGRIAHDPVGLVVALHCLQLGIVI